MEKLYVERINHVVPLQAENISSEVHFLKSITQIQQRTRPILVLLDSRGKQFTSEEFAAWIGRQRDQGVQTLIFAIGPADGWSPEARKRADMLLSLGPMTLPHELARVVLSEQVYRAFTILSGHPYHSGH